MLDQSTTFDSYQEWTRTTAIYPGAMKKTADALIYCTIKGGGECGEFQEKIGKLIRGGGLSALDNIADDTRAALVKELSDRLWYLARTADELGVSLSEVARVNIAKLSSRKDRGVIHGSGDDR